MTKKRILQLMLILGFFDVHMENSAKAINPCVDGYPSSKPDQWVATNMTNPTYTLFTINTTNYRDFNTDERNAMEAQFAYNWGGNVSIVTGTAAWSYNCHGYVFVNGSGLISSVNPFLASGRYQLSDLGDIWLFGTAHSAYSSGLECGYQWYAKCGNGPLAYHTAVIYGSPLYQFCRLW
jgi:hypothetical protein